MNEGGSEMRSGGEIENLLLRSRLIEKNDLLNDLDPLKN